MSDLAGFSLWLSFFNSKKGNIYYTSKLSHTIASLPKNHIEYIKQPMINKN
jgi:hypothetical protein